MLVIADEHAVRVGGQGGLAGAGEAEEHGGVARIRIHVRGAVHREHAVRREQEVHDGEDALLHLARVAGARDDDDLLVEVDQNRSLGVDAVQLGDALAARRTQHGEVLGEAFELLRGRADEQLMDEQVLARQLVDDADGAAILVVGAREAVKDEHVAALQIGRHTGEDLVKALLGDRLVDLAPRDLVVDVRRIDHKAVVRGTTGILAGHHGERAGIGEDALAALDSLGRQLGRGQVMEYLAGIDNTPLAEIDLVHVH